VPWAGWGVFLEASHAHPDLAFISHYEFGVFVVDVSNRNDIRKIGEYDTHPEGDFSGFHGAWGVFPFFPNSPRLFVVSDIERGLFVLELEFDPTALAEAPTLAVGAPHALPNVGWPAPNPMRVGSNHQPFRHGDVQRLCRYLRQGRPHSLPRRRPGGWRSGVV
jgi:hypothetical protein